MKRLLFGLVLACVCSGMSLAAAGKNTSEPSTIILNTPAQTLSASSTAWEPKLGESVTYTVTYPKTLDRYGVRIQVLCYQNGNLVYGEARPYDQAFLLGGAMSTWYVSDGAADCHADLYDNGGQKFNPLASVPFSAAGRY